MKTGRLAKADQCDGGLYEKHTAQEDKVEEMVVKEYPFEHVHPDESCQYGKVITHRIEPAAPNAFNMKAASKVAIDEVGEEADPEQPFEPILLTGEDQPHQHRSRQYPVAGDAVDKVIGGSSHPDNAKK